ncbi:HD domain-containing protein [Thermodesulfovibrio sp. 1176]|uniref:HD-GYP domain-containing protein n=1 Tax=Thermodesulfovibrio sp. 1176 TaxID=3043424 RepID=UPI0024829290|nr:HD domain-containing phosphohydrolase [Thermodesulfovibrio sp. 1176]MDI1472112.1 HD domain-containing protein [Thermodesulfovibrio sp. 1176]
MEFYWLCLHGTYIMRKRTLSFFDGEIELIGEHEIDGRQIIPSVIEGRDLFSEIIDLALQYHSAIFIESFIIDNLSLQIIKNLAIKGTPFFWTLEDVVYYLKFIKRIEDKKYSFSDVVEEIVKLESSYHSVNVSELSFRIAECYCSLNTAYIIRSAALLHDAGKLLMPRSFINAPRWYTSTEKEYIKLHSFYGLTLLKKICKDNTVFYQTAKDIILYHHERADGSGYPYGRRGDEIPLPAKIVSAADVYDALRTNRPYRSACDHDLAITYLKGKNGIFDEKIIKILEEVALENSDIWSDNHRRNNNRCIRRG